MVSKSPIAIRNGSITKKDNQTAALLKLETDKLLKNLDICSVNLNYKDETKDIDAKGAR